MSEFGNIPLQAFRAGKPELARVYFLILPCSLTVQLKLFGNLVTVFPHFALPHCLPGAQPCL